MTKIDTSAPHTLFIGASGAGLPEVDGLYVPSTEPPVKSESGTMSSVGYWNGKAARSPAISYSSS